VGSAHLIPLTASQEIVRTDIQWSPDGRWISFPVSGALGIVNPDSGQAHELSFSNVLTFQETSWSPDGERVAILSQISPRMAYWTIHTATRDGEYLGEMDIELGNVRSIDWHPGEDTILYVSEIEGEGRDVYSIDASGAGLRRLTMSTGFDGPIESEAKWSPGAEAIAYDTENRFQPDPAVDLWVPHQALHVMNADGSADEELVVAPGDVGHAIDRFEWAPDGRRIAYISTEFVGEERGESNLRVIDVCTGEDLLLAEDVASVPFSWNPAAVRATSTIREYPSAPSPHAAAADDRAVISLSNVSSLTPWWSMPAEYQITRAEWSPDEMLLAIDHPSGIQIWAFPELTFTGTVGSPGFDFAFIEGSGGPELLVAGWGSVVAWDPIKQTRGAEYRDRQDVGNPTDLGLSADGQRLATSTGRDSEGGTRTVMHVWDVETGEQLLTFQVSPVVAALEIAFRPDGAEIATARRANSTVYFWDTQTGTARGRLEGQAVEYSPRGDVVATTRGRSIWIWDAGMKGLIRVPQVSGGQGSLPIAFSPDGSLLAAGVDRLTIWETAGWTEIAVLPISGGSLQCLRFSPSGRYLAAVQGQSDVAEFSGSDEYTVTIWAVED
jgi:WD40 repeat protein